MDGVQRDTREEGKRANVREGGREGETCDRSPQQREGRQRASV